MLEQLKKLSNIKGIWGKLSALPGGRFIFSKLVGQMVPYTGTISPYVLEFGQGKAKVQIEDRRGIRNHLRSIHALALANVGEFSTGLSVISVLPEDGEMILTKIEVEYLKKARGTLIAEATCPTNQFKNGEDLNVTSEIKNEKQELVCKVVATWRIRRG